MRKRQVRRASYSQTSAYRPTVSRSTKKRQWPLVPVGLLIGSTIVIWLLFTNLRIQIITVEGASNASEIQGAVFDKLQTDYGGGYTATLPVGELERFIANKYPASVEEVRIQPRWLNRSLQITITERVPVLWWQSAGVKYALDKEGIVISSSKPPPGAPLIRDVTNLPVQTGQKIAPQEFVNFSVELYRNFTILTKLKLLELRVQETTSELTAITPGFFVRFDTTNSAQEQLENVARTLKSANSTPNEYIDVRIPYKAYFR